MAGRFSHLKQWWLSLINGIIFLLLSVWIFIDQTKSYKDLLILLSIGFVIIGGLRAYYGLKNLKRIKYSGLLFMNGLIEFCVFIIAFVSYPEVSDFFTVYVGFILLFRSILGIGISINFYYSHFSAWFIPFITSILGVMAAFLMVWKPFSSGVSFLIYPAITFLLVGIAQLGLSSGLKSLRKTYIRG